MFPIFSYFGRLNTTDTNTSEQFLMHSHFYLISFITIKLHI